MFPLIGIMPQKSRLGTYRKRRKETEPSTYVVSLPLAVFTDAPLSSAQRPDQRLTTTGGPPPGKYAADVTYATFLTTLVLLISGWTQTYTESALHFTKLDFSRPVPQLLFCLTVFDGMSWTLSSSGVKIASGNLVSSIPDRLESVTAVLSLLSRLDQCQICEGNADGKFGELLSQAGFLKSSGILLKKSNNI